MISDDSDEDYVLTKDDQYTNDFYHLKYKFLLEECTKLQRANEILVFRTKEVNRITKRRRKEVDFFKKRLLSNYNENWTVIPTDIDLDDDKEEEEQQQQQQKPSLSMPSTSIQIPGPMFKINVKENTKAETNDDVKPPKKKPTKRRTPKSERDPNAPKRPSNPFFQFCQEQRQILMEQLNSNLKPGEAELSKQELTRQLAIKWKTLSTLDKQIYVDRYERSKEKYAVELSEYRKK